ncbi:MAG: hypothetical protein HGA36_02855 [Candidatus Moranbacteria bacterium]|nr:hypothetical protein [Candidatus Moranbacteria bacterium]
MKIKFIKIFFLLTSFFMLTNFASAAPIIAAPTPINVSSEQDITITGSGFGSMSADRIGTGRLNHLWLDFAGGNLLQDSICTADQNAWMVTADGGRVADKYYAKRVDPNAGFDPDNVGGLTCGDGNYFGYAPGINGTLFLSYWFKIPSTATSGKNMRIRFDGPEANPSYSDFYTMAGIYSGTDNWFLRQASDKPGGVTNSYVSANELDRDQWQRVDMLFTGGATPSQKAWIVGKNSNNPQYTQDVNMPPVNNVAINIGAGKDNGNALPLNQLATSDYYAYDDVYASFTQARVEVCDANVWSSRNHCELQLPTVWSSTNATIKINQGSFPSGQAYLYIIDANGEVNSAGYAINFVPTISNVSGTIGDGQNITISGAAFGSSGPSTEIFDDFEKGTVGQNINTGAGSAQVGQWTSLDGAPMYSNASSLSGNNAMRSDMSTGYRVDAMMSLPANTTKVFGSWWVYLPAGNNFPGEGTVDGTNWKQVWMMDGDSTGIRDYVVTLIMQPSGCGTGITHNDTTGGVFTSWLPTFTMPKGRWVKVWYYVDGKSDATGKFDFWYLDNNGGIPVHDANLSNIVTLSTKVGGTGYWDRIYFNAYGRQTNNSYPMFDDIYVATGPNAQARVEIGNAATYAASTNLTLATVNTWSDAAVSATVRQGSFTGGEQAYLYVFDKDGNVNATGFPMTFGSTTDDVTPPSAPSGLSVL